MNRFIITVITLYIIAAASVSHASNYCEAMPKAEKEGDLWYISESAFTRERALDALSELETQINDGVEGLDFLVENELALIKGYLYLSYLAEHKKQFGKEDAALVADFCRFIREEAYVTH